MTLTKYYKNEELLHVKPSELMSKSFNLLYGKKLSDLSQLRASRSTFREYYDQDDGITYTFDYMKDAWKEGGNDYIYIYTRDRQRRDIFTTELKKQYNITDIDYTRIMKFDTHWILKIKWEQYSYYFDTNTCEKRIL